MLKQFYEKVLPSKGVYCITGINKNKTPTNRFAETLDELEEVVTDLLKSQTNIFVAPGSFKNHSRRADNAAYMRSFFIDLDVGDGKDYDTKTEALEAVGYLLEEAKLPVPAIVDSGGGIHAYWVFGEDIPIEQWKPYAERFKRKVQEFIPIDPVVTADAARIMRAPFTINYKYSTPEPTGALNDDFDVCNLSDFDEFLGPVELSAMSILAAIPKGLDEDTKKMLKTDNMESVFDVIAMRSMEGTGCAQIKYVIENAAALPEPVWHSALSIARQCTDWEEAIHELSKEYPKYSPNETVKKANETFNKPHSCEVFNSRNPGICDSCPHRGRVTNPLVFGRRLKEATSPEAVSVRQNANAQEIPEFPDALRPFVRGLHGGVYYLVPPKVDKKGVKHEEDPILIIAHDLWPIKRMYSKIDGECLLMRLALPNDGNRDFDLPLKHVYAVDKLKEILGSAGVGFNPEHIQKLMLYIVKWSQYMIVQSEAEQMRMQMGWTENHDGFVLGHAEIRNDGRIVRTASSPLINSQAKLVKQKGEYSEWQKAANALNTPGMEMHMFGLMLGFGSPLMHHTSTSGGSICFTGGSGNGKTGALYGCMSVYGDPKGLSLENEKGATSNGFIQWYLGLKNIPFGLDEASNYKPEWVSELVHKVSQGKGKIRMQSSVNAVREIEIPASLIAFLTSNQSLYNKIEMLKLSPAGELARLIEYSIKKPKLLEGREGGEWGQRVFDAFRHNYGHAAHHYIPYLFKQGDRTNKAAVDKWIARFSRDFKSDSTYRFYENMIGATFGGGELAGEAGIIVPNLERIYERVLVDTLDLRDGTPKINVIDYENLVGEFMNTNQASALVFNDGRIIKEPRNALIARIDLTSGMFFVSKTEFKKHLAAIQVSARDFELDAKKMGLLAYSGKQRLSSGWSGIVSSPISVYGFRINVDETMFRE
jgi:hypothetical protein